MSIARITVASCSVLLALSVAARSEGSDRRLIDATKEQDRTLVQTLLKQRADVNARDYDGATALHWAVYLDNLELTQLLIRSSANVNAANEYGVTPLALACTNANPKV